MILATILIFATLGNCLYEYRDTTFYPNGSQEILRDWMVLDFTNPLKYEIYDVKIGDFSIPAVLPGQNVRADPYLVLPPKNFPISIEAKVNPLGDVDEVEYTIRSYHSQQINLSIVIPRFNGLKNCTNCSIDNKLNFSFKIAPNSTESFKIIVAKGSTIPDGEVYFELQETLNLSFGLSLPVSIQKTKTDTWSARFEVSNPSNLTLTMNLTAWVEKAGSKELLFDEIVILKENEKYSRVVEIEYDGTPIFYFKAFSSAKEACNLKIIPVNKLNGSYILGYAILKGINTSSLPIADGGAVVGIPTLPVFTTPTLPSHTALPTPKVEYEFPMIEINLPPKIPIEILVSYSTVLYPATFLVFFSSILVSIYRRREIVASGTFADLINLRYYRRIYTPPSNPIRGGIVVQPDGNLVELLISAGLRRDEAETLAIAIKTRKPILTNNIKVAKLAIIARCMPVMLYGRS